MRYYIQYMERYYPILKSRYEAGIMQGNIEKQEKVINEIKNNRALTEKQREDIIRQIRG